MNTFTRTWILALAFVAAIAACGKPAAPVSPPVEAFAPPTAVVQPITVATPDPVLVAAHEAVVTPAAPVPDAAVQAAFDAEKAAYAKAEANAVRASCLRSLVDAKASYDIKHGSISDIGNVITDPLCRTQPGLRTP